MISALVDHLIHQTLPVVLVIAGGTCLYMVAAIIAWKEK